MKGTIIAVIIMLCIIALCISVAIYTTNFCDELQRSLEICILAIEENNHDTACNELKKTESNFDKKSNILKIFIPHRELDEIEISLSKALALIRTENMELCIPEFSNIQTLLEKISDADNLTINNIM